MRIDRQRLTRHTISPPTERSRLVARTRTSGKSCAQRVTDRGARVDQVVATVHVHQQPAWPEQFAQRVDDGSSTVVVPPSTAATAWGTSVLAQPAKFDKPDSVRSRTPGWAATCTAAGFTTPPTARSASSGRARQLAPPQLLDRRSSSAIAVHQAALKPILSIRPESRTVAAEKGGRWAAEQSAMKSRYA